MNEARLAQMNAQNAVVKVCRVEAPEAELDVQVEFCAIQISATMVVHAIDHETREVLAYVDAPHHDEAFVKLNYVVDPIWD